jgi:hypothetical protein
MLGLIASTGTYDRRRDGCARVGDGRSRFGVNRREAADTAILYAFDLIEHDGEVSHSSTARPPWRGDISPADLQRKSSACQRRLMTNMLSIAPTIG